MARLWTGLGAIVGGIVAGGFAVQHAAGEMPPPQPEPEPHPRDPLPPAIPPHRPEPEHWPWQEPDPDAPWPEPDVTTPSAQLIVVRPVLRMLAIARNGDLAIPRHAPGNMNADDY
jgi:hypothetical protein